MSSFANELNSRSQWNKLFTLISVKSPRVSQWEFKFRSILKFSGSEVLKVMVRRLRLAAKQFQLKKLHSFTSKVIVLLKKRRQQQKPHTGTSQPKIVKIKCYNNHWHWKTLTFLSIFFLFVTSHSLTRLPYVVCHIFNISPKEWSRNANTILMTFERDGDRAMRLNPLLGACLHSNWSGKINLCRISIWKFFYFAEWSLLTLE